MKKATSLVLAGLAAAWALLAAEARGGPSADTPVVASSPSPAAGRPAVRGGRPVHRPMASAGPVTAVKAIPENHTQVEVVSVDTEAATMTFTDVEGETNTW